MPRLESPRQLTTTVVEIPETTPASVPCLLMHEHSIVPSGWLEHIQHPSWLLVERDEILPQVVPGPHLTTKHRELALRFPAELMQLRARYRLEGQASCRANAAPCQMSLRGLRTSLKQAATDKRSRIMMLCKMGEMAQRK